MAENLTTFQPAQKEKYEGIINESLNSKIEGFGWIDKEQADGGPNPAAGSTTAPPVSCHFVAHISRNSTGGFQSPDEKFATSGNQGYVRGSYLPRVMYWPIMATRSLIRNTRTDSVAYAKGLVEGAQRAGDDVMDEMERIFCGDGSGTLGVNSATAVTFAANVATVTLTNPADARKFKVGQIITTFTARTPAGTQETMISAGTGTPTNAAQVTGVDLGAGTVQLGVFPSTLNGGNGGTWTAWASASSGDVFTKGNDNITNNLGARTATIRYEPMGINGIVDDRDTPMETSSSSAGGLFGIIAPKDFAGTTNASGVSTWASYVNRGGTIASPVGRAYSDAILASLVDRIRIDSGMKPDVIFTSYGGQQEYENSKQGIRRTVNSAGVSGETTGGSNVGEDTYLQYRNIPIVPMRYAPVSADSSGTPVKTTSFIAVSLEHVMAKEWHKVRFLDDDGQTWRMQDRKAQFEAVLEYAVEIICNRRNCHAKATDIIASDFT